MPKFFIIAVVVLAVAGFALVQLLRNRIEPAQTESGFRDFIKDPDLWNEMSKANEDASIGAADAAEWNEDQLAKEVEHYVFSPKRGTICGRLDVSLVSCLLRRMTRY